MKNKIILIITLTLISCNSQKTYFENGNIKTKGKIVNSKKQGKWKYFYNNGKIKIDAEYLDNIPNAKWTFYFENNQIKKVGNFKKENWSNFMEHMRKSGSKNPEEHYLNKDGEWIFFYESGELKEIGKYNNQGLEIGEWKEFYKNGKLKYYRLYIKRGVGTVPTKIKYYYPNGILRIDDKSFTTGEWTEYYENGIIKTKGNNKNGVPNGKWERYYDNGQLSQSFSRNNNKIINIFSCFDKNGNKLDKGTLKDGNGTIIMYDENGNITKTHELKNGNIVN